MYKSMRRSICYLLWHALRRCLGRLRLTCCSLSRSSFTVISCPRRLMGSTSPTIGATSFGADISADEYGEAGGDDRAFGRILQFCCRFLFGLSLLFSVRWLSFVRAREQSRMFSILDISFAFHICVSYDVYAVRISFFGGSTIHKYLTLLCFRARFSFVKVTTLRTQTPARNPVRHKEVADDLDEGFSVPRVRAQRSLL